VPCYTAVALGRAPSSYAAPGVPARLSGHEGVPNMTAAEPGFESGRDQDRDGPIVQNDIGTTREELLAAIDATLKPFAEGDVVTGKVVKIDQEEVLIDIGYKAEGVIPARELTIRHDVNPREVISEGEEIEALILQIEDAEGRMILSKKRAQYEKAWGRIEEIKRTGGVVTGTVIEVVKGGLIVDIGLRGFLPASLVELRRVRDLQQFIGKELECKIIELDRNRNNVVLSRRAFLEEAHSVHRKEFLENLKIGEVKKGTVSSIVNFGAFVDLGGVDGLVHVSELSWQHIDHPGEVVKVGDEIDVEVLHVDLERDRVSLSLKNTQEDPWRAFARSHQPGDVVKGKISRLVPFGAFVQVSDGIEGLVHISELSDEHVELPEQVVAAGQEVMVRLIDVELERRRISLSLKRAAEPSYTVETTPELEKEEPAAEPAAVGEIVPEQLDDIVAEQPPAELEPEPASAAAPEVEAETAATPVPPADEAEPASSAEPEPEVAEEPEVAPEPERAPAREEKLEGELLETERESTEDSLESIVEEMKKDRQS
jgi:small subunit ribosomal protein S1